jgi:hypothetical protein
LTHEDMTCYQFRQKENDLRWKIIWHASPPGAMAFRSLFGSAKVLGFNWLG